jgi:hypothetical protein
MAIVAITLEKLKVFITKKYFNGWCKGNMFARARKDFLAFISEICLI